jgi:hypothetical protein
MEEKLQEAQQKSTEQGKDLKQESRESQESQNSQEEQAKDPANTANPPERDTSNDVLVNREIIDKLIEKIQLVISIELGIPTSQARIVLSLLLIDSVDPTIFGQDNVDNVISLVKRGVLIVKE